ncbi:MAG: carboxypeptidase regulatory-like domain-containing protein [Bryobacteraceae bacterium]|jgi:plastocyanin
MKITIQRFLFASIAVVTSAAGLRAGVISGTVSPAKAGSVVYVEAVPGKTFPAPAKPFVVDQKSLLFQPHVIAVPLGATVEFQNSDKVQHNIFWPSISGNKKMSHNMGTWPTGEKRDFKFDTPGVVPLLCNVHPEMSGYIIVSPTPYYAVTDESGSFKIADVPDGSYTVSAWHEGMKILSKPVTASGTATVEFSLAK